MIERRKGILMGHPWKALASLGGGSCLIFLFLGFYSLSNAYSDAGMTNLLLCLVGMAVMGVFTILCVIADKLFSKDK